MPVKKPERIQAPDGQEFVSVPVHTRESWSHWFPDADEDEQGTIEDLLAYLKRIDRPDVSADNIRFWQKVGVIPAPVKRWHNNATRALYPVTHVALVIDELLELQERGYTLQQIAPRLRAYAASMRDPDPVGIGDAMIDVARAYGDRTMRPVTTVEVRFIDADGRDQRYRYNVPPERI